MLHVGEQTTPVTIAVDVGGTGIKGICVGQNDDVLARETVATFGAGRSALDSIIALIHALRSTARAHGHEPALISLCTPGTVVPATGTVRYAANLGWIELPLERLLVERFDLPVTIEHDARAAAIAEAAASGLPSEGLDLVFIPIGTGVSSAILIGGQPLAGATGSAGEIGHVSVVPGGERCACGQLGCVEAYSAASTILSRYQRAGGSLRSVSAIVASLDQDPTARQIWADAVDSLARGLAATITTVDPAMIVIGGGLSRSGDALLTPLRHRLAELLTWRQVPEIRPSALGTNAGVIGAAMLGSTRAAAERHRFALALRDGLSDDRPN